MSIKTFVFRSAHPALPGHPGHLSRRTAALGVPLAALQEAGARLVDGMRRMMPDARVEQSLVGFDLP